VHRDLKPENLLVEADASGKVRFKIGDDKTASIVKVADFGLAKAFDPSLNRLTKTGQIMGTPLYMSPEQCKNTKDVTQRADIYALGIILCELVTGEVPFEADDAYTVMKMHMEVEPKFKRMDRQMEAVVRRCLQKNARDRYATLEDLRHDLQVIAGVKPNRGKMRAAQHPGLVRWALLGGSVAVLITVGYVLHQQIFDALNQWWNPKPIPTKVRSGSGL
jgi:serine/threonine-protein kinase